MHDAEAQAHLRRIGGSHFDPEKEKRDQDGTEYQFGSAQSLPNIFEIPLAIREQYLPVGQIQYSQWGDYMDCATRDPINAVEAYLTYAYRNGLLLPENKAFLEQHGYVTYDQRILVSNRFNAILSGTTRRGNSLKAPLQSIHSDGFIPQHMLPEEGFTFDSYHDPKAITKRMREIGKEAAARFTFAYDQSKQSQFASIAEKDFVSVALYAWPQAKSGVYPKTDKPANHAVAIFRPRYFVIDNYFEAEGDFIKELAPDFVFYEDGYRMYFSSQQVPKKVTYADLLALVPFLQAALIQLGILRKQQQAELPVPQPKPSPKPDYARQIYDAAYAAIGTDVSPDDLANDRLGCAESLSMLMRRIFPELHFPIKLSTRELYEYLSKSPSFQQIHSPELGCIVLNVTGTGNGKVSNGHVGIMGKSWIMSNHSDTGTWEPSYTIASWRAYFETKGGMPTLYFKRV